MQGRSLSPLERSLFATVLFVTPNPKVSDMTVSRKLNATLPLVFILSFCYSSAAHATAALEEQRSGATSLAKHESPETTNSKSAAGRSMPLESLTNDIANKGKGLLAQIGGLIDQRIGWLRPTTVKEQALIWLAFAVALPWPFVSWIRPIISSRVGIVRFLVVAVWTTIAIWVAWNVWGQPSGQDQFASTMLIVAPMLWIYFNTVVRSVAEPATSST